MDNGTASNRLLLSRRGFTAGACAIGFAFTALGRLAVSARADEGGESPSGEAHESLTILFNDVPSTLDPANGWDGWFTTCRGLTETLVVFDQDMALQPCLATAW